MKPENVPAVTSQQIARLPKTDLHVHLDGSLRVETILDLAAKQGVSLPATTPDGLARAIHMGEVCADLNDYLRAFDITLSILQEPDALYRAAYELAEDNAKENVWYMEVRYSPILHLKKGMKITTAVESVLAGLRDAQRDFGIRTGVIICGIRNINPETSLRLAELAVAYKNKGIVAFDLAGAEVNFPAKDHKDAFYLILKNNVNCTCHAGEAYGPESIHQALHYCGSHRIGHGTRLREDGDLLNYVNDHRIPVEACVSSNVQTRAVSDYASHPLKFYYNFGLRVTINTDNRLITDTTVTKEIELAVKYGDFTLEDLKEIMINGFKSAFLPFRDKQALLRDVTAELAQIH
ncbi:MAG: adenosine deaminase [Deltaproteobacteria bacterium]|nr:adenosine deaminase [Deltaproteobacteria bacterium]